MRFKLLHWDKDPETGELVTKAELRFTQSERDTIQGKTGKAATPLSVLEFIIVETLKAIRRKPRPPARKES